MLKNHSACYMENGPWGGKSKSRQQAVALESEIVVLMVEMNGGSSGVHLEGGAGRTC
jgi:hypothetical protein